MSAHDFDDLTLFITGPTYIRPDIAQAAALPVFGHRDAENEKRFGPIHAGLRALAGLPESGGDYVPLILNGSGSTALEAAMRSLVADDETVLCVSVGAFGDLFHKLAVVNGKRAEKLAFAPGQAMDLARVTEAIERCNPAVLAITHNETSTGVANDIQAACDLANQRGIMVLVDGVSIFGGVPLSLPDVAPAFYATATQKCLALPAGFGIGFVREEALAKAERVKSRGYATDLLAQAEKAAKHQTLSTPNTALANQLAVQLDHILHVEGIENRFARHERMRAMVESFVSELPGYDLFAQAGSRSPSVTAVSCPTGVNRADLAGVKETLRGRGYLFDPGYGKLNAAMEESGGRLVFRIGHLGDLTEELLAGYLAVLGPVLTGLGG